MNNLSIIISDSQDGEFHDVREIIAELEKYYDNFSTHAMSPESTAYLMGKEEMLEDVIYYLKRIVGDE